MAVGVSDAGSEAARGEDELHEPGVTHTPDPTRDKSKLCTIGTSFDRQCPRFFCWSGRATGAASHISARLSRAASVKAWATMSERAKGANESRGHSRQLLDTYMHTGRINILLGKVQVHHKTRKGRA